MRGRRPLPDEAKILRGTFRPDRARPPAVVSPDPPTPPSCLTDREREVFAELVEHMGATASATYSHIIGLAASVAVDVEEMAAQVHREGRSYQTETLTRPHPLLSSLAQAERHLQSLLGELGLSPATAARLSAPPTPTSRPRSPLEGLPRGR